MNDRRRLPPLSRRTLLSGIQQGDNKTSLSHLCNEEWDYICSFLSIRECIMTISRLSRRHHEFVKHHSHAVWMNEEVVISPNRSQWIGYQLENWYKYASRIRRLYVEQIATNENDHRYELHRLLEKAASRLESLTFYNVVYLLPLAYYPFRHLQYLRLIASTCEVQMQHLQVTERKVRTLHISCVPTCKEYARLKRLRNTTSPQDDDNNDMPPEDHHHSWSHEDKDDGEEFQYHHDCCPCNLSSLFSSSLLPFDPSLHQFRGMERLIYHTHPFIKCRNCSFMFIPVLIACSNQDTLQHMDVRIDDPLPLDCYATRCGDDDGNNAVKSNDLLANIIQTIWNVLLGAWQRNHGSTTDESTQHSVHKDSHHRHDTCRHLVLSSARISAMRQWSGMQWWNVLWNLCPKMVHRIASLSFPPCSPHSNTTPRSRQDSSNIGNAGNQYTTRTTSLSRPPPGCYIANSGGARDEFLTLLDGRPSHTKQDILCAWQCLSTMTHLGKLRLYFCNKSEDWRTMLDSHRLFSSVPQVHTLYLEGSHESDEDQQQQQQHSLEVSLVRLLSLFPRLERIHLGAKNMYLDCSFMTQMHRNVSMGWYNRHVHDTIFPHLRIHYHHKDTFVHDVFSRAPVPIPSHPLNHRSRNRNNIFATHSNNTSAPAIPHSTSISNITITTATTTTTITSPNPHSNNNNRSRLVRPLTARPSPTTNDHTSTLPIHKKQRRRKKHQHQHRRKKQQSSDHVTTISSFTSNNTDVSAKQRTIPVLRHNVIHVRHLHLVLPVPCIHYSPHHHHQEENGQHSGHQNMSDVIQRWAQCFDHVEQLTIQFDCKKWQGEEHAQCLVLLVDLCRAFPQVKHLCVWGMDRMYFDRSCSSTICVHHATTTTGDAPSCNGSMRTCHGHDNDDPRGHIKPIHPLDHLHIHGSPCIQTIWFIGLCFADTTKCTLQSRLYEDSMRMDILPIEDMQEDTSRADYQTILPSWDTYSFKCTAILNRFRTQVAKIPIAVRSTWNMMDRDTILYHLRGVVDDDLIDLFMNHL